MTPIQSSTVQAQRGTDERERQRAIDRVLDNCPHGPEAACDQCVKVADMLRADAETIQRQTEMIAVRDDSIDRLEEQLRARDEEIAGLRDALANIKFVAQKMGYYSVLQPIDAALQEKSRDAG